MRIAVLGGGHQGYAVAGDLAHRGHEVSLWRRTAAAFGALAETRRLTLRMGSDTLEGDLARVTGDLDAALTSAELVVVAVPATAHHRLASRVAPSLDPDTVVLLTPGNLGTLEFAVALAAAGREALLAETPHPPFGARKRGDTEVAVAHPTIRLPLGVLPAPRTGEVLDRLEHVYPQLLPARDVLDAALCNPNPVIHPALMVTNAGPIDAFDRYDIHATGTTRATMRLIRRVDGERMELRESLGYDAPHWDVGTLYDAERRGSGFFPAETFDTVTDSGDWNEPLTLSDHRYLEEDAGRGLACWAALAAAIDTAAPVINAVLAIAEVLSEVPLTRSAGAFDLVERDVERLREVLHGGVRT